MGEMKKRGAPFPGRPVISTGKNSRRGRFQRFAEATLQLRHRFPMSVKFIRGGGLIAEVNRIAQEKAATATGAEAATWGETREKSLINRDEANITARVDPGKTASLPGQNCLWDK